MIETSNTEVRLSKIIQYATAQYGKENVKFVPFHKIDDKTKDLMN